MNKERTGARDLTISRWHRDLDDTYDAVDTDLVGYCPIWWCRQPLYMIEDTRDMGKKSTTCLEQLCRMTGAAGWLIQYWGNFGVDLDAACRRVWPPTDDLTAISLQSFAEWVAASRRAHHRLYHTHWVLGTG